MPRGFREDLFKKMASADLIFGRLPYPILTKTICLVGWKRMELNRLIRFIGVREHEFNAIYRRSLLIKMHARFVDPDFIEKRLPNAATYGVFPRQNDLKPFLRSGPGILAGLRLQHGFERLHDRDACRTLLDDYVLRGRDQGATEKYLREACGLQPPRKTKDTASVEVPLTLPKGMSLGGNDDSQEAKPSHAASEIWKESVRWLLKEGYHGMTSGYVRQCPLGKGPGTKSRKALWESMTQSDEWQRCYSTKSAHMNLPVVRSKHAYADVIQTPDIEEYSQFQETYDLNALRAYVDRSPHRSTNV
ncbi:MAG: hypothetical protein GY768_06340, partial [Planctomycetaceae bacterium]|nr:hypothetical protein [Planctomycetaceae bacterium]